MEEWCEVYFGLYLYWFIVYKRVILDLCFFGLEFGLCFVWVWGLVVRFGRELFCKEGDIGWVKVIRSF